MENVLHQAGARFSRASHVPENPLRHLVFKWTNPVTQGVYSFDLLQKLPASVVQMLDAGKKIPAFIENLGVRPHEFLRQANEHIATLKARVKGAYDESAVDGLIEALSAISVHPNQAQIFFPQVFAELKLARENAIGAPKEVQQEHKRISETQLERVKEETERLVRNTKTLLGLLLHYKSPHDESPIEEAIDEAIYAIDAPFQLAATNQSGIGQRVLDLVIANVSEATRKVLHPPTEKNGIDRKKHPLYQLISLIDKFKKTAAYPGDIQYQITHTLNLLETYSPLFKGIIDSAGRDPHKGLDALRTAVIGHIQVALRGAKSQNDYEKQVTALFQKIEKIVPGYNGSSKADELVWIEQLFRNGLPDDQESLLKVYDHMKGKGKGEPAEDATEEAKRTWAFTQVSGCRKALEEAYEEYYKRELAEWMGETAKQRNICEASLSNLKEDLIEWTQRTILSNRVALAMDDQRPLATTLLDSVIAFEQFEEGKRLQHQLLSGNGQGVSTLAQTLDAAIQFYEQNVKDIKGGPELLMSVTEQVLDWMGMARDLMLSQASVQEREEIIGNYEKALVMHRKGEHLEALKFVKELLKTSKLAPKMYPPERVASPLKRLSGEFKTFLDAQTPPVPPSVSEQALRETGHQGEDWNPAYLATAIEQEAEKVCQNALMFCGFQFVAKLIKPPNPDQLYQRFVAALKTIAGPDGDHQMINDEALTDGKTRLQKQVEEMIGRALDLSNEKDQRILAEIKNSMRPLLANRAGKQELSKALYFSLLSTVIETQKASWAHQNIARGFTPLVYLLLDLFIRPFTKTLIQRFQEDVVNASEGRLTAQHLGPVKAGTNALGSYVQAMKAWPERLQSQRTGDKVITPGLTGGNKENDLRRLLQDPQFYGNKTPKQVAQELGYYAIDQYVRVANICTRMDGVLARIGKIVSEDVVKDNQVVNTLLKISKGLLSIIPYLYGYTAYAILKLVEVLINVIARQSLKFMVWQGSLISQFVDGVVESLFAEKASSSLLDNMLAEELEKIRSALEAENLQGEEPRDLTGGESQNKETIKGFFLQLLTAIDFDNYVSPTEVEDRLTSGHIFDLKKKMKGELAELLAKVVLTTSKSSLNTEQLSEMLYRILKVVNEGLQGGEVILLEQKQKEALAAKHGKRVEALTAQEIEEEAARLKEEASNQIPALLQEIVDLRVNPAVEKEIDKAFESSSQVLLDYIHWLKENLFSYTGVGAQGQTNLLDHLEAELNRYDNASDKNQLVRNIHSYYGTFIHQLSAKQEQLDKNPSPNAPELNILFNRHMTAPIQALTKEMTQFVTQRNNKKACKEAIARLKESLGRARQKLGQIESNEAHHLQRLHKGPTGIALTSIEKFMRVVREAVKSPAQALVKDRVRVMSAGARKLYQNPLMIKHLILWQMRNFLDPIA